MTSPAVAVSSSVSSAAPSAWQGVKVIPGLIALMVGTMIWWIPVPAGLDQAAWRMFAIFMGTIVGVITRPLPIAATVLIGMVTAMVTGVATFEDIFRSYSQPAIWLIMVSFFLAHGLIKTGLAIRASYGFVALLGKRTLGLAYGIICSELVLAPFIPSLVARSGGIIFPIVAAMARQHTERTDNHQDNTARFLILSVFQASLICSAMFLTSMAANPLAVQLSAELGISISWMDWALAAIVPGIASLIAVPWVIYWLVPPSTTSSPDAPKLARKKLAEMGPVSGQEWSMLGVFLLVLSLWLFGPAFGIGNTVAVMIGLCLLLLTGILSWKDCLSEHAAWDTLFWLGALIAMGSHLKTLGLFAWFGDNLLGWIGDTPWPLGFTIICLCYFYSHYFFASNTAHLMAMFAAFLVVAIQLGTPPMPAALMLAILSSLFGGLTHYGCGPAPIFYSAGHVPIKQWWGVGLVVSVVNLAIWFGLGAIWWKFLGYW